MLKSENFINQTNQSRIVQKKTSKIRIINFPATNYCIVPQTVAAECYRSVFSTVPFRQTFVSISTGCDHKIQSIAYEARYLSSPESLPDTFCTSF